MPIHNFGYLTSPSAGGTPAPVPSLQRVTGPIVQVQIELPTVLADTLRQQGAAIPSPVSGIALIDTGASVSAVDVAIARRLGMQPVGIVSVGTAGGTQQQEAYPARFTFPGTTLPAMDFGQVLGADLSGQLIPGPVSGPLVALLGRDVLQRCILIYNGPMGSFVLAF